MAPLLVIEDPELDAAILEAWAAPNGFHWLRASNPSSALQRLEQESCALVLAGPKATSNGTPGFLAQVRQQYPQVPVVVLTGDEPDATIQDALRTGIAGCLPRQNISSDLARTLQILLNPATNDGNCIRVCYTLDNRPELLPLVVARMRNLLDDWPFTDANEPVRVTVALSEALDNALYHGNLELDSALRQGDGSAWREEGQRRRALPPYRHRKIRFRASIAQDAATFTVSDEGPGFNRSLQIDCTDPENLERCSGRGLMLMRMYMDEVTFNPLGNEVTLLKRRPAGAIRAAGKQ